MSCVTLFLFLSLRNLCRRDHFHGVAVYLEANVSVFKLHAVDAASVLMILRSGVERQHLCQRLTLFFPHVAPYLYWYRHLQSFS